MKPTPTTRSSTRTLATTVGTCLLAATAPALAAQTMIVCSELDDTDQTRLVMEFHETEGGAGATGLRITRLEIVTPEFLWPTPDQPETPRFPAGMSDVSPNLAAHDTVSLHGTRDADGRLRIVDFGVREPDALALEGLRGSLALHESWHNARAIGSLYYTATGNRLTVTPLVCRRFDEN